MVSNTLFISFDQLSFRHLYLTEESYQNYSKYHPYLNRPNQQAFKGKRGTLQGFATGWESLPVAGFRGVLLAAGHLGGVSMPRWRRYAKVRLMQEIHKVRLGQCQGLDWCGLFSCTSFHMFDIQ